MKLLTQKITVVKNMQTWSHLDLISSLACLQIRFSAQKSLKVDSGCMGPRPRTGVRVNLI